MRNNAVVYSFHIRGSLPLEHNRLWRQLLYSVTTIRKFNKEIDVLVYISPSSKITENAINIAKTLDIQIIKFENEYEFGVEHSDFYKTWSILGYAEFLWHRWKNAYLALESYDNILYLDTDTIFHKDVNEIFSKYGDSDIVWAREDNSYDLMEVVNNTPGMNDGQFLLSKSIIKYKEDSLEHAKKYINITLEKTKNLMNEEQHLRLHWVLIQYAMYDFYKTKNMVRYFDSNEVMLHIEPTLMDTSNLILHHYYNGNSSKFVPQEFM